MGILLEKGVGCKKNLKKAFQWLLVSAKNGDSDAQLKVGYAYEVGRGTEKNYRLAVKWYKKGAVGS